MSWHGELNLFAIEIIYDIEECFLQYKHHISETKGFISPRCSLYSKYGQKTVVQYLKNELDEIYDRLENDPTLQRIDENVFEDKVSELIAQSQWRILGHETFYKTCARIVALGIFFMTEGFNIETKIFGAVRHFAERAFYACFLDRDYDVARKNAQDIVYTLFKQLFGDDISVHATQAENEIGWSEIKFSNSLRDFIDHSLPQIILRVQSGSDYTPSNSKKFEHLTAALISEFGSDSKYKTRDSNENYLRLAVSIGIISIYSVNASYTGGVQNGIDNILRLFIFERRYKLISRHITSDH